MKFGYVTGVIHLPPAEGFVSITALSVVEVEKGGVREVTHYFLNDPAAASAKRKDWISFEEQAPGPSGTAFNAARLHPPRGVLAFEDWAEHGDGVPLWTTLLAQLGVLEKLSDEQLKDGGRKRFTQRLELIRGRLQVKRVPAQLLVALLEWSDAPALVVEAAREAATSSAEVDLF